MRVVGFACIITLYALGAYATEKGQFRPATEAQIRKNLPGAQDLTVERNNYQYKADGRVGYKITNGQICVRNANDRVECVRINYDGKNLQMIDKLGNREVIK